MSNRDSIPVVPIDAPKTEEVWRHYKGDNYKIVGVALHPDETWIVVYEPMYEGAISKLFTRPVAEWSSLVEWEGKKVERFTKVS